MTHSIDLIIIVSYLIGIVGIGLFVALRGRKKGKESAKDYFLASGTLKWPVIGLALFSTNISTIHLVAFAQEGFVKRWRPHTTDKKLVTAGRWTAFVTVILAVIWSLQLQRYESIFAGVSSLISYIAPPTTAVFLGGVFWKRASRLGATVTMISGSALGFIVFLLYWNKETTGWNVPFLMAAFYLCVICMIILIVFSLIRPHQHSEESKLLVWDNPLAALRSPGWPGLADYRVVAAALSAQ